MASSIYDKATTFIGDALNAGLSFGSDMAYRVIQDRAMNFGSGPRAIRYGL
jgi:hypothetical protein